MAETIEQSIQVKEYSRVGRGSDMITLKVWNLIAAQDYFTVWYLTDFKKIGKPHKIRKALAKLEGHGLIKKIKAYPVFWQKTKQEVEF